RCAGRMLWQEFVDLHRGLQEEIFGMNIVGHAARLPIDAEDANGSAGSVPARIELPNPIFPVAERLLIAQARCAAAKIEGAVERLRLRAEFTDEHPRAKAGLALGSHTDGVIATLQVDIETFGRPLDALVKDVERPTECYYVDLQSGDHPISVRAKGK